MPDLSHELMHAPLLVCGVDEAGRGPWAGDVVASAVIFPFNIALPATLNDSKQVKKSDREMLLEWITAHAHVGIGIATVEEIDTHNILQATYLAMQRAVASLPQCPDIALIDGNRTPVLNMRAIPLIKGDSISASIAAASIVAKVTRDRMMKSLDMRYPEYGFAQHAGYGTKAHHEALLRFGPCHAHRKSFAPIRTLLSSKAA